MTEHDLPLDEYHRAGVEITNGNPDVYKSLYSRSDDVTLANPFGPPVRGWNNVSATLDRAAENYDDGEAVGFENVATVLGGDLAYTVEIESYRARVGGAPVITPVSVRVTTVFRREDGGWKVLHRHADPITGARPRSRSSRRSARLRALVCPASSWPIRVNRENVRHRPVVDEHDPHSSATPVRTGTPDLPQRAAEPLVERLRQLRRSRAHRGCPSTRANGAPMPPQVSRPGRSWPDRR
jgi:ketosteroid isomerase-like protein